MTEPEADVEFRERQYNAYEALADYHALDPTIPVGGLPPREYDRIRRECAEATLTPQQAYDLAWVDLEYAMAIGRSDINYATEEPYSPKEVAGAFDSARRLFKQVADNEAGSRLLRAQARTAQASVDQHKEIVTGKPRLVSPKPYLPYLNTIRTVAQEFIDQPDLTDEERDFTQALTVQATLTEYAYQRGWYLPAPSRQPWDMTAYQANRSWHDVHIYIGGQSNDDDIVMRLDPRLFNEWVDTYKDQFAGMRAYLDHLPGLQLTGKPQFTKGSGEAARYDARIAKHRQALGVANVVIAAINDFRGELFERGVIVPAERVKELTKEVPNERDISDYAMWYLTEYDGSTLDAVFTRNLEGLNKLRQNEDLLPDERAVLSWMLLDHARMLALDAGKDRTRLDEARLRFGTAITSFQSTKKMFARLRRPGQVYDAGLAAEAAEVQRGLFTSTDPYALRRIIADYHKNAAGLFVGVKDIKGDADQVAALRYSLDRATLSLLPAAADPELRHLLLPTSPRLNHRQVGVAFPAIYDARVSGYDLASQIEVQIVDGDDIVAGTGRVEIGRNILVLSGDPLALLRQLSAYLSVEAKAKGGANQKGKTTTGSRSEHVRELSERLAFAISDADV